MSDKRGLFIVVEGGDGAGKTTAIHYLRDLLEEKRKTVIETREPGGTLFAEKMRSFLLSDDAKKVSLTTNALLYAAARRDHVENVILPNIEDGNIVLCDRFYLSTLVYQNQAHRVNDIIQIATGGLEPDLTILMDVDYEVAQSRRPVAENFYDKLPKEVFERNRAIRNEWYRNHPNKDKVIKIDANRPLQAVHESLIFIVNHLLGIALPVDTLQ